MKWLFRPIAGSLLHEEVAVQTLAVAGGIVPGAVDHHVSLVVVAILLYAFDHPVEDFVGNRCLIHVCGLFAKVDRVEHAPVPAFECGRHGYDGAFDAVVVESPDILRVGSGAGVGAVEAM